MNGQTSIDQHKRLIGATWNFSLATLPHLWGFQFENKNRVNSLYGVAKMGLKTILF
jgi:hypothetical protein